VNYGFGRVTRFLKLRTTVCVWKVALFVREDFPKENQKLANEQLPLD